MVVKLCSIAIRCYAKLAPISKVLARQPIPKLDETLRKYLRSVQPFLTNKELSNTETLLQDFLRDGGVGQKLQKYLEDRARKEENWLSDWWLNTAYLEFRDPVVVWSSPGLVFPIRKFKLEADQLMYAANMIKAALSYKSIIDQNQIPQEMVGSDLLDMAQYNKIFGTCRIPRPKRDELVFNKDSKHIIVIHNNTFFKLTTSYEDGQPLTIEDLYDNLLAIVENSTEKSTPVGILTSENRDSWAQSYQILEEDEHNKQILNDIHTSSFVLCLDSSCDLSNITPQTKAARQTIHGGGSECNGANRWFDKTIQFIVNRDGQVGLTYEHSPAEGQPIAMMMDYIVDFVDKHFEEVDTSALRNFALKNKKLQFNVPSKVIENIRKAEKNLDALVDDLELNCFTYKNYGKRFIKEQKLSPDSFIQMAQQFAFYRLHKVPGAHYESASTRRFLHGRTETIRSCSVESIRFAQKMLSNKSSRDDRILALKDAVLSHKNYTVEAMKGYGIDRHLLGLKIAAKELGVELPPLFNDPSYTRSTHMRISTSQVASKCDGFMCYGPLVNDGYACCYNPREEDMNFAISALKSNDETDATKFKESLENSLDDMNNLLVT